MACLRIGERVQFEAQPPNELGVDRRGSCPKDRASASAEHGLGIIPVPELVLRDSVGVDVFTIVKPLVRESALGDGRLPSAVGSSDDQ